MKLKRPMLSATATAADLERLKYPLLASPKLDGIRCIIHPELGPVTRSFKPVPNVYIRELLHDSRLYGFDGELMLPNEKFNPIQSAVMSQHGTPTFEFWAFDNAIEGIPDSGGYYKPFKERHSTIMEIEARFSFIKRVKHIQVCGPAEVSAFMAKCLEEGYEGVILRDPEAPYKCGRSTLKQQGMIKFKEWFDAEGTVVGFEELLRNQNVQERDAFGLAERSSKKEGMVAAGTLGALVLSTQWGNVSVGSGFDTALRERIWKDQQSFLGKTVTFKYQAHGMQDKPRFPIFMRFREAE